MLGSSLWKNPPPDWPPDVLYKDPNNGGLKRPKQKDLSKMACHLAVQLQVCSDYVSYPN